MSKKKETSDAPEILFSAEDINDFPNDAGDNYCAGLSFEKAGDFDEADNRFALAIETLQLGGWNRTARKVLKKIRNESRRRDMLVRIQASEAGI